MVTELVKEPNAKKMVRKLRVLGKIHIQIGCKPEWFDRLLIVFNDLLSHTWPKLYNFRVQYCFTELYNMVKDTMLGKDFYSVKHTAGLMVSLDQLDACLANPRAVSYLGMLCTYCTINYKFKIYVVCF